MQLLEVIEILEHCLDHLIDRVLRGRRRGHEGGADAEGGGVIRVAAIHAARNYHLEIVIIVRHQFVDRRAAYFNNHRVAGGRGFLVETARIADQPEEGVDLVVAERAGGFRRLHLRHQFEIVIGVAHGLPHDVPGGFRTRTGVADIDPLADQVLHRLDAGVGASDEGDRLGVNREDRAEFLERTGFDEGLFAGAVIGVILPVRLGDAHVELAGADGVDVVDGTAGGLHRAAHAVFFAALVDETADGAARGVIDTGDAAGADGDEFLLRGGLR